MQTELEDRDLSAREMAALIKRVNRAMARGGDERVCVSRGLGHGLGTYYLRDDLRNVITNESVSVVGLAEARRALARAVTSMRRAGAYSCRPMGAAAGHRTRCPSFHPGTTPGRDSAADRSRHATNPRAVTRR